MKKIRIKHFQVLPILGLGYWKEKYSKAECGMDGVSHHIIILCFKIKLGHLMAPIPNRQNRRRSGF